MTRLFWQSFMAAFAALASGATLVTFVYDWRAGELQWWQALGLCAIFFGVCTLYGVIMTWRKSEITLRFNPKFNLTIEDGDIFNKTGIIVIPVNEYFDTIVNNDLISKHSIHGLFINKYWPDRIEKLDNEISIGLKDITPEIIKRKTGKDKRYEIGTCVDIRDGANTYVLFVLTHFDKDNHAYLDRKEYSIAVDRLLEHLQHIAVNQTVYMPLFGTGLTRLKRSSQRILSFLIDTIDFNHSHMSFPHGIKIVIKSLKFNGINLNSIERHFEKELRDS